MKKLFIITFVILLISSCETGTKKQMLANKIYVVAYKLRPLDDEFCSATVDMIRRDGLRSFYQNYVKIYAYMEIDKDLSFKIINRYENNYLNRTIPSYADIYMTDSLINRMNRIIAKYPKDTIFSTLDEKLTTYSGNSYMLLIEKDRGKYISVLNERAGAVPDEIYDYIELLDADSRLQEDRIVVDQDSVNQIIDRLKSQIPFEFLDDRYHYKLPHPKYKIKDGNTILSITQLFDVEEAVWLRYHNNMCRLDDIILDKLPKHLKEIYLLPTNYGVIVPILK